MTSFPSSIYGVRAVLEKLGARLGKSYVFLHSKPKTLQTQLKRQTKFVLFMAMNKKTLLVLNNLFLSERIKFFKSKF